MLGNSSSLETKYVNAMAMQRDFYDIHYNGF